MATLDIKDASSLVNFGIQYLQKYESTNASCDIDMAILLFQRATRLKIIFDIDRALYWNNLAGAFLRRYQTTANVADLDQAIQSVKIALDTNASAQHHMNDEEKNDTNGSANMKPMYLNNAGGCYLEKFQRFHQTEDLRSAINLLEESVELTPDGHADTVVRLSNLGAAYFRLYELENDVKLLDHAIKHLENACDHSDVGSSELLSLLCNLSGALYKRYEATERLESLQADIRIGHRSVQRTPFGHYDLAARLSNLANMLESRYLRLGMTFDLWAAMKHAELAVQVTSDNRTENAKYRDVLAMKRNKWYRLGVAEQVNDQYLRQMVQEFPPSNPDDPDNARRLQNHADLYGLLYSQSQSEDDLRLAIALSKAAVDITRTDILLELIGFEL